MIPLAKPYIPDSVYSEVQKVLVSGKLIQGDRVACFEKRVQEYLKVPHAFMVSSGTAALHLALLALGITSGDEVIVPAFTYPATANVVEIVGAKPVFVDINLSDYCIDPNLLEKAYSPKTKAVMPVHEFGQAADIDPVVDYCHRHGLKLIEDAACAFGTAYNAQKVSTFGDFGCFSLHPRKAITTGEGGIIVTANEDLAERIRLLRNHGAAIRDGKTDFSIPGLNYRMTELQAALGLAQLEHINYLIGKRTEQAQKYGDYFKHCQNIAAPAVIENRTHVFQSYHILLMHSDRDAAIEALKTQGIETNIGAQALHCLSYYRRKYGFEDDDFENAKTAYMKGLVLPIGAHLDDEEIDLIAKQVIQTIE